jgi:hypothetical protein
MTCGLTGDAFPALSIYTWHIQKYMNFIATIPWGYAGYLQELLHLKQAVLGAGERPHIKGHTLIESYI